MPGAFRLREGRTAHSKPGDAVREHRRKPLLREEPAGIDFTEVVEHLDSDLVVLRDEVVEAFEEGSVGDGREASLQGHILVKVGILPITSRF